VDKTLQQVWDRFRVYCGQDPAAGLGPLQGLFWTRVELNHFLRIFSPAHTPRLLLVLRMEYASRTHSYGPTNRRVNLYTNSTMYYEAT
jgi:hypothetical protein